MNGSAEGDFDKSSVALPHAGTWQCSRALQINDQSKWIMKSSRCVTKPNQQIITTLTKLVIRVNISTKHTGFLWINSIGIEAVRPETNFHSVFEKVRTISLHLRCHYCLLWKDTDKLLQRNAPKPTVVNENRLQMRSVHSREQEKSGAKNPWNEL